jgi:hypothetical protein
MAAYMDEIRDRFRAAYKVTRSPLQADGTMVYAHAGDAAIACADRRADLRGLSLGRDGLPGAQPPQGHCFSPIPPDRGRGRPAVAAEPDTVSGWAEVLGEPAGDLAPCRAPALEELAQEIGCG